jgi:hypothetical protein
MNNLITNSYTEPTYKHEILNNCYTTRATAISEKHIVIPCKTSAGTPSAHDDASSAQAPQEQN